MAAPPLDWAGIVNAFRVAPARDLLSMDTMARHQDVRQRVPWLQAAHAPLALLFISHRWQTLDHPDPDGRQWHAIQQFLRRVCVSVEAMLVPKVERLQVVPSLVVEGTLQAEEIARRILGFGPFGANTDVRTIVVAAFDRLRGTKGAFQDWLAERIGVWLDYTCMPQRPLSVDEIPEFQRALRTLDTLVASSTVVVLRTKEDEYPCRGWCGMECFLGSEHSFARCLFVDADGLKENKEIALPPAPVAATAGFDAAAQIMSDSYGQDLTAFNEACEQWLLSEGPLVHAWAPDAWSAYRSLQGSGFLASDADPNPFRRAMDAIRDIETFLIERWLMSGQKVTIDIAAEVVRFMDASGLRCSQQTDVMYVGLLLSCHGWIDALKPLLRDAFNRYVEDAPKLNARGGVGQPLPQLNVTLKPVGEEVRALFTALTPSSARAWDLRLSSRHPSPDERQEVEQLLMELMAHPPQYAFVD